MPAAGIGAAGVDGEAGAADVTALADGAAVDTEASVERGGDGCVGARVGGMLSDTAFLSTSNIVSHILHAQRKLHRSGRT